MRYDRAAHQFNLLHISMQAVQTEGKATQL